MLVSDHYLAVLALLEADDALRVEDAAQLDDNGELLRAQYAILYPTGPDDLDDDRFTAEQALDSDADFTYTLKAVSVTALGCAYVADHILAALVRKVPDVEGRRIDPIRYVEMTEVQPDFSARPPLYQSDVTISLTSRRG
jgi:hypothetical protein